MTLYVYTVDPQAATDDGPFEVDADTRVVLTEDHDIAIHQVKRDFNGQVVGTSTIKVTNADDLARAVTKAELVQAERLAMDDRPMDDGQRKAIFAALREVHGTMTRERRLGIISAIVRRQVESFSTRYPVSCPLTRAEASHVLDVLNA